MKHSDDLDQFAAALSAFQAEVKPIPKNAVNPFFKSKYADLETITTTIQPLLDKHGLAVSCLSSTVDGRPGLCTTILHKSGQWISDETPLRPAKDDPQGIGGATTYQRRYSISSALNLSTDDDDDGNSVSQRSPVAQIQAQVANVFPGATVEAGDGPSEKQWGYLAKLTGQTVEMCHEQYGALSKRDMSQTIDGLKG